MMKNVQCTTVATRFTLGIRAMQFKSDTTTNEIQLNGYEAFNLSRR